MPLMAPVKDKRVLTYDGFDSGSEGLEPGLGFEADGDNDFVHVALKDR